MKNLVCVLAAALRKQGQTMSAAMRNAWLIVKGKFAVNIEFAKDSGALRTATANLKSTKVSQDGNRCVSFTEGYKFRSFRLDRLISISITF
jgi:hypothetical protein